MLLSRADRIAAVSEVVARDVVAAGADPARVVVAPNAADWAVFAEATPAALPFADDAFVVAFAGSFYPWHGTVFLAEAFAELLALRPRARLLLVGDGTARPQALDVLQRAVRPLPSTPPGSCRAARCRPCSRRPTSSSRRTPSGTTSSARP